MQVGITFYPKIQILILQYGNLSIFADALDFTKKWLQSTADYVTSGQVEGGATCTPTSAQLPLTVHNHAYLRLLKWDYDAESFPEVI